MRTTIKVRRSKLYFGLFSTSLLLFLASALVFSATSGPAFPNTFTDKGDSTRNVTQIASKSNEADAGNLTELYMYTLSQTQRWQGYYGNISGYITLDDGDNWTLFDWQLTEPKGQVYAVNQTISDWTTAHCINYSAGNNSAIGHNYSYDGGTKWTTSELWVNITTLEKWYNITPGAEDGVDETFNATGNLSDGATQHSEFFVGNTKIDAGSCPAIDLYQTRCCNMTTGSCVTESYAGVEAKCDQKVENMTWVESKDGIDFQEVLLTVNNSQTVIFTAIIENDQTDNDTDIRGFNSGKWDFQMLVLEDGTSEYSRGQDYTTTYYFYVELY